MGRTVSIKKRGGETEILKRGEQAGSMGGCLKNGRGRWNPLTNYGKVTRT